MVFSLPFKGRAGVGMGFSATAQESKRSNKPNPILTFPLTGGDV